MRLAGGFEPGPVFLLRWHVIRAAAHWLPPAPGHVVDLFAQDALLPGLEVSQGAVARGHRLPGLLEPLRPLVDALLDVVVLAGAAPAASVIWDGNRPKFPAAANGDGPDA